MHPVSVASRTHMLETSHIINQTKITTNNHRFDSITQTKETNYIQPFTAHTKTLYVHTSNKTYMHYNIHYIPEHQEDQQINTRNGTFNQHIKSCHTSMWKYITMNIHL